MKESFDQLAIASDGPDSELDDLIEVLTAKLQAGEQVELDEVGRRHPEYAERLRRLLPALVMMADFRNSSSRELDAIDASGPGPGLLGDFRIIREVGRGGMGVVYEAHQLSLDRRVALKVLPLAAAMDSKQLQRFQLEAHAAACLNHTNIVPVHAVGCERGVPFYAMQFIEGRSLAQLIAELRRLEGLDQADQSEAGLADFPTSTLAANLVGGRMAGAGTRPADRDVTTFREERRNEPAPAPPAPSAELGTPTPRPGSGPSSGSSTRGGTCIRTVAQFGVQVAEALDHAHTRGILHRDIKPANLLLDDQGQLWITDFGLAQIQGNPGLTLTGDILGTLRYMSPEQALAKRVVIDGRTDVYSLGVTLYEVLTLRPAIDGRDRQEILRKIAQEEPAPPRKLNPAVPRDLETILLKAMAKEPTGRYATAKELADELQRFLEDRPIRARRPSLGDRAAKLSRRHRAVVFSVVTSTFLFLILTVVVLVASNFQIRAEEKRTAEQRERAESNSRKAREVVDRMFTRVAKDLEHTPRMEKIRRALLEDALEFYQGFLKENETSPALRHEAARAYMRVGEIEDILGRFSQAVEPWNQAASLLEGLAAEFPAMPDYRRDLAFCHRELCYVTGTMGHRDESWKRRRTEFQIRERLAGDFPGVLDYRRDLARCLTELALGLENISPKDAEDHLRQALLVWADVRKDLPDIPEDLYGQANSHHWLGGVLMDTHRLPEAEQELRKALVLAERALRAGPDRDDFKSRVAHIQDYLGVTLFKRRKHTEAADQFRSSIKLYESLVQDFPHTPEFLRRQSLVHSNLAAPLRRLGRVKEAEISLQRAIDLRRRLAAGNTAPNHRWGDGKCWYAELGVLYLETGRVQEAADAFRLAQAGYEARITEQPGIGWLQADYALFLATCPLVQFQDTDRALKLARRALQLSPRLDEGWRVLGVAECRAGHWAAAIEALDKWATFSPEEDPTAGFSFAIAHGRLGHTQVARKWYEQSVGLTNESGRWQEELSRLRAEAAAVLGLPEPKAPARKEVPHPAKD